MKTRMKTLGRLGALAFILSQGLVAQTITWKGHTWQVTNGGMAGVAQGSTSNVFIDSNGYLHLKISKSGSTWTAAELFSTDRMGFGTYQWQIEGPVDNMDKCVVLGLFPYGPADGIGADGENEIDIEFSKWNGTVGSHNADFTYYPATGYGDGQRSSSAYDEFTISLGGTNLCTARTVWSSKSIQGTILKGLQSVTSNENVLRAYTFAPASGAAQKIPQVALPLGMNLWCFDATPATTQEVIIRDFQFIPEGSQVVNYAITASAGSGGSISPSGTVSVSQGGSQTFTITPASGYTIASVTVDGVNRGAIPSYLFSNVQAAHSISAAFTPVATTQFTITASAGTGGTINPVGSVKVNQGASQTFTITPASGYTVSSVTVDGVNQGAIKSYAFSNVQSAHTISASFTPVAVTSNLALGRPASASSLETSAYPASLAFDGSASSRWSSSYVDPSWISVDLGSAKSINRVVLKWEAAYGKAYQIQVSSDNASWTTVYTRTGGTGGTETLDFTATSGRYVRLLGSARGTQWGYSLWEFEVYGNGAGGTTVDSNIAPAGTGYLWSKNASATANTNRAASSAINDGNTTNSVVVNASGEGGSALWEGAGVVWSAARTLSSASFINGKDDGYGNGYFQAGCKLQFSTDGTTWTDSGWSLSPAYPYSATAYGQTYAFSGAAKAGVKGARIVGQTGASSWSWTVSEVQFIGK